MLVKEFVELYKNAKVQNNKINPNAIEEFIRSNLDITTYLPFNKKREIVDMLVESVVTEENGIKRVDSVAKFLAFIVAMVASHTTLVFGDVLAEDYDALSQCGVLEYILAMFQRDYSECDALFKAALADELADNNLNVIIGKFLNGVLGKLDVVVDAAKGFAENADLSKIFGADIKGEDIAKLLGVLDKLK